MRNTSKITIKILMMEYLAPDRNNQPHSQALQLLLSMNYQPHISLIRMKFNKINRV